MRRELFQPTIEGEARLLLLIDAFSGSNKCLEGRTKLAKLDFFLRYPAYMARALRIRKPEISLAIAPSDENNIETRMVRYRYGPWDPAYFAILGRLIGKGLVIPVGIKSGVGYKTTEKGQKTAQQLSLDESWADMFGRVKLLRRHFDISGSSLKDFIYDHFPEITGSEWGDRL